MRKRRRRDRRPLWDQLDDRCLPSGYTPSQVLSAYGMNGITFTSSSGGLVAGNGAGQTIALIEMYSDPNIQASLNAFDAEYGLPNTTLDVINQAGSQTNIGWAQEESLDVEWAHAMAPGANIVVVEAAPGNTELQVLSNLMTAVHTASQTAGVTVVSMSWGFNEFSSETSYDSNFTTPGITYIAASGDSGVIEWPAASPNVVAVGGTSLNLSSSGGYGSESGWIDAGGGVSLYEPEPSYQDAVQSTGYRSTPDVSFDADPNTGVSVCVISPNSMSGQGQWEVFGGTSVGAPSWAGIVAIIDQGRALGGEGSLSSSQTLTTLYSAPATAFNKVAETTGHSGFGGGPSWGGGSTNTQINTAAYNTQTGLGTPNGVSLIQAFVPSATATPTPTPTPALTPTPTPTPTPAPAPWWPWPWSPTPTPTPTPAPTPTPGPTPPPWSPEPWLPVPMPTPTPTPTPTPPQTPMPSPTPAPSPHHPKRHKETHDGSVRSRSIKHTAAMKSAADGEKAKTDASKKCGESKSPEGACNWPHR